MNAWFDPLFWVAFAGALLACRKQRVFWPLLALGLLLLFNSSSRPGSSIWKFGTASSTATRATFSTNGAKVMLLALGMTLVIATAGVDLSVGAIMAIAGAVAAQVVTAAQLPARSPSPPGRRLRCLPGSGTDCWSRCCASSRLSQRSS